MLVDELVERPDLRPPVVERVVLGVVDKEVGVELGLAVVIDPAQELGYVFGVLRRDEDLFGPFVFGLRR